MNLTPQNVEIIGRCRAVCHIQLSCPHICKNRSKRAEECSGPCPSYPWGRRVTSPTYATIALARADKLVKHNLSTVGKVSKLRLPGVRALGSAKDIRTRNPRQHIQRASIDYFIAFLTLTYIIERIVTFFGVLIDKTRMTLAKGAPRTVLSGKAHWESFSQKRAKANASPVAQSIPVPFQTSFSLLPKDAGSF